MIRLHRLTKRYGKFTAVDGIDLEVPRGELFGLLGPNGAGKTTLIGIATSLVNKSAGSLSIFGHDIDRELEGAKACVTCIGLKRVGEHLMRSVDALIAARKQRETTTTRATSRR